LESIAGGLKKTREKDGPKAVMGFHNIPLHTLGYTLAARLADLLECTTGNYATAGDSAGMVANKASFGNLVGGHDSKDAVNSKYLIIWGLNPAETNTVEMRDFLTAQAQGTKLVVIDPRFTATATKADWWIPVRPGTDGALALGMAKVIVDRKLHDTDFLTRFTVAPFLVREDNGLFLREKDIREGGSDTHMCWDRKAGLAKPSQESTLIPGIMDGYGIYPG
jgi:anaerobic selenocysteine-containing dehydrogenase